MVKSIMVPLDNTADCDKRISAAVTIAQKFDAHIMGVHVVPTLEHMMQTIPYTPYTMANFSDYRGLMMSKAKPLWEKFEHKMSHAGILFDKYQEEGEIASYLKLYSRCSDLTIISQIGEGVLPMLGDMTSFMMESGLPVIAIPQNALYPTIGNRILVTWNNSAQCARSIHDSLPFLQRAETVNVLTVTEYDDSAVPAADICRHLARHGVQAEALQGDTSDTAAEVIMLTAEQMNADLIIAGAWGHSRVTEIVMGGVTKKLLSNQLFPVFFSH